MSFLNPDALSEADLRPSLSQRGRASVEFLGTVQHFSSGFMRSRAREDFASDPEAQAFHDEALPEESGESWQKRLRRIRTVARRYPSYRFERFLQRYVAEEVYLRGIPAVEERRGSFEEVCKPPTGNTLGSLELCKSTPIPKYYEGIEWHLEPGGWDGYELYGALFTYVAGPCIFSHGGYAAVEKDDDITRQRVDVIKQLPKPRYDRIYEPGCGGLSTLSAAYKVFPEAELVGSDLSPLLLENGHRLAEQLGIKVAFKQRDARSTGEPDDSFDAVVMYALLHEMPHSVAIATLEEAFRILRPGGDLVISDPPPFRAVDPLQALILDWDTKNRGEPFFSSSCAANWPRELKKIGFENSEEYPLGQRGYPWVTRANKPE